MKIKRKNNLSIETTINTIAILLTGAGGNLLIEKDLWGLLLIFIGFVLEWFKYWGRNKKIW